jgi:hypothetical protein
MTDGSSGLFSSKAWTCAACDEQHVLLNVCLFIESCGGIQNPSLGVKVDLDRRHGRADLVGVS